MAASRLVTGEERLDPELGRRYAQALAGDEASAGEISALVTAAGVAMGTPDPLGTLKAAMAGDARVMGGARRLAYLWYAGTMLAPAGAPPSTFLSEDAYFGALMWRCVGAHPPGLSGGYFGHWRYPPDV